ncbi:hypothetical protein [Planococcus shenhongbingii]|uniref:Cupin domain-containing protein n=1 Tax=Planococcus shenhongbingii TaxID=3058398 RepID=A0ABT8NB00_9BACL|nr:hypothetical protein [Planococcus sp. N017]MDN7245064.1 hypothetical protein [Planococcus sp. N017]
MELMKTSFYLNDKAKHIQQVLNFEKTKIINIQLRQGETIPEHEVDADVVIIVKSGKVKFVIEGQPAEVSTERILYMVPHEKHSLTAIEASDLIVMQIKR